MSRTQASWKAIGLIILVFVLGLGLGAVGTVIINARVYGALQRPAVQPPLPVRGVARLTQELNLTPDQQNQLRAILQQMQGGYDGIRQTWQPQIDTVRAQGRNQIRQILTPEQLPKYENYLHMLDEERAKTNTGNGLPAH